MAGAISSAQHSCCFSSRFANPWDRVECHLETGATAMARHTLYVAAVMARTLADQSEAQAHSTTPTLTHTGRTVEGRKNALAFLLWHARSAVGNAEVGTSRMEGDHGCFDGRDSRVT